MHRPRDHVQLFGRCRTEEAQRQVKALETDPPDWPVLTAFARRVLDEPTHLADEVPDRGLSLRGEWDCYEEPRLMIAIGGIPQRPPDGVPGRPRQDRRSGNG